MDPSGHIISNEWKSQFMNQFKTLVRLVDDHTMVYKNYAPQGKLPKEYLSQIELTSKMIDAFQEKYDPRRDIDYSTQAQDLRELYKTACLQLCK